MKPYHTLLFLLALSNIKVAAQDSLLEKPHKSTSSGFIDSFFVSDSLFKYAHVGASIYNLSQKKHIYQLQSNKYFTPASNMKVFTCYAAMKYLTDSLHGIRVDEFPDLMVIHPTGDPTFLDQRYKNQPVLIYLQQSKKKLFYQNDVWQETPLGKGWAWDDELTDFSPERSAMPLYGNIATFNLKPKSIGITPSYFSQFCSLSPNQLKRQATINRKRDNNWFDICDVQKPSIQKIPFVTSDTLTVQLLGREIGRHVVLLQDNKINTSPDKSFFINSQPTDTMLREMMINSDNFLAEQSLLMVSNQYLGYMKDAAIIDNLLKTCLAGLPQKPAWVDGCGLSRYSLVTPDDLVWVLTQMEGEFGLKRMEAIFPTGNQGTLKGYFNNKQGRIFAKTGTLSHNFSLTGFLTTNKGEEYLFSIMVNNFVGSPSPIKKEIEKLLYQIMDRL